jgi:DNA invertase Pin-like site-specific DNA recombinase
MTTIDHAEFEQIRDEQGALAARIRRSEKAGGTPSRSSERRQLRRELDALAARIRRLMLSAGVEPNDTIPQQRLEQLVDGATGKAATA